jgi:dCMP deaminase
LTLLEHVASRSTCARRKVGAIIIDEDHHVLSMGYNGVPKGMTHCTEKPCPGAHDLPGNTWRCWAVHAEMNAILQCHDLRHAHTLYTSCAPCFQCAKVIANTHIARVVSLTDYADYMGRDILELAGVRLDINPA